MSKPPPDMTDEDIVLQKDTTQYSENLRLFFNKEEVTRFPSEIHVVKSSQQVANALKRAQQLGVSVGVRSGGHLPSKPSLIQDGILIDVSKLNRQVVYEEKTQQVAFGPAVRVYEAWEATTAVGRFFPYGHAPDVALGGFCLAGGQGFFMRGWGATITNWVVKMEVVVPDGRVLIASKDENNDLFWAARGSGQAFFGVVTRIWSRTIPAQKLYGRSFVFNVREKFEDLMSFAFDRNEAMPKLFTECAVCTMHSELFLQNSTDEHVPESSPLLLLVNVSAYAETLAEATDMLCAWDVVPEIIENCLIKAELVKETDWKEFFQLQHRLNPQTPDQKWGIHSILNDPEVPRSKVRIGNLTTAYWVHPFKRRTYANVEIFQLLKAVKPALCNLPTRSSYGCVYMADTLNPDENDSVFSLPQQYYISTFSGWKAPELSSKVKEQMEEAYQKAETVACGMYIADFNASSSSTHSPTVGAIFQVFE
ncbi:hypothetical protein NW762_012010 [Fusarium torreyae]|uniref:FAD-binding PCMH-type domain-containing protein n=1 Tax=Fusarium torreyae TaxID=1237075 RepID=A0A9W8V8U2_9HYPO|nr:hypothetical protein NW762_012010 [Fusarium torreyae]